MIELPKKANKPTQNEFLFKRDIESSKVSKIMQAINYGWASTGACLGTIDLSWSTTSPNYTTVNAGAGLDLDQINPMMSPRREEIGALRNTEGVYIVEFQVFARDVDLEVALYRTDTGGFGAKPSAAATDLANLAFDTSWEWKSVFVLFEGVPTFGNTEHLVTFKGRYAQNGSGQADIKQVAINEIRHVNLTYDVGDDLDSYCSEWVGPYADGVSIPADTYLDGDGCQFPFYRRDFDGAPQMVRDAVSPGVHAIRFDGSNQLVTDPFNMDGADGVVVSMAFRDFDQNVDGVLWTKRSNSPNYAFHCFLTGTTIRWRIYLRNPDDGTYSNFNFNSLGTRPPQGVWVDLSLVWSQSRQRLEIWINGELVETFSTGSTYTVIEDSGGDRLFALNAFTSDAYHLNAQVSTPTVITRDLSIRELDKHHQWRRSQHGIY